MGEVGAAIARVLAATETGHHHPGPAEPGSASRTHYRIDAEVRSAVSRDVARLLQGFAAYPRSGF